MSNLLNTKARYLLVVVPFVVIFLFSLAYLNLRQETAAAILHEKFVEKQQSVDLLAAQVDAYIATPAYQSGFGRFELILSAGLAQVDAQPFTYAALYDGQMDNVSARTPSYSSAFEPLTDAAFQDAVRANDSGTYVLPYTPDGDETRDMHIYYRWIPTDSSFEGRYLAVVAVSRYSVESILPLGVWALPLALCAVTTALITAAVWLLRYLGEIYVSRKGGKWRGHEE